MANLINYCDDCMMKIKKKKTRQKICLSQKHNFIRVRGKREHGRTKKN